MAVINEEVLLDIKVQDEQALSNIANLTAANSKLKDELSLLQKAYKNGNDKSDENVKQQAILQAQIKENTSGIRENSKELKTNAAQVSSASDSINGMRARVADLNTSWNSLSATARESDVGKAIQSEMKSLNEGINSANLSVSNFKDNVGNYPDAMANVGLANTQVGKTMQSLGLTSTTAMKQMAQSVVTSVKTVLTSLKALLANPIILIITLIVAAGLALYNLLKNFTPIINPIKDAFAALGAVMNTLKTIFLQVVTGTKSLKDAISGTGEAMERAAKQAIEYNKIQREIGKQTNINAVSQAKYKNQIDELILQSKNRTLTEKQRSDAIQKALDIEKKAYEEKKALAQKELKAAELKISKDYALTDEEIKLLQKRGVEYAYLLKKKKSIDSEDIKNLSDKLVAIQAVESESIMLRGKAQNRQDQLDQKADEKEKARQAKNQAAREKAAAEKEKQDEENKKRSKELDNFYNELLSNQAARLKEEIELKKAASIASINALSETLKAESDSNDLSIEQTKEYLSILGDAKMAILENQSQNEFDFQTAQLKKKYDADIALAKKLNADTSKITQAYNIAQDKIDAARTKNKLDVAANLAGNLAELFGKETKLGKAAASAQIAIQTYQGSMAAWSAAQVFPAPFNAIVGAASVAATVALGAKSIKDIWAVKAAGINSGGGGGNSVNVNTPSGGSSTNYTNLPNLSSIYSTNANQTETAQVIQSSQPNPVVSVTEITKMQNIVEVKENSKL